MISVDEPIGGLKKILHFLGNAINNLFPSAHIDPRLKIKTYRYGALAENWEKIPKTVSPNRKLSDLFLMELPWQKIQQELKEIRVLDAGCGSGRYGPQLVEWSGKRITRYAGIDTHEQPDWTQLNAEPLYNFKKISAHDFKKQIPVGTNFFFTQSALEHFTEDLAYFEQVREYVESMDFPIMQVHLFPSSACLRLYLLHGVRQYTPRTVSKITRLFSGSDSVLFGLGGRACVHLHWKSITWPRLILGQGDRREENPDEYDTALRQAIEADMRADQRSPDFYALIIQSRFSKKLI